MPLEDLPDPAYSLYMYKFIPCTLVNKQVHSVSPQYICRFTKRL